MGIVCCTAHKNLKSARFLFNMFSSQLKHKKLSAKPRACAVDIVVDDDSLSSLGTSSTMGYRDSFGDNDDGCFHLLERSVLGSNVTM